MESKEVSRNIRLGAFVLGGLVLFFLAIFLIGSENNLFSSTFSISATFKNVEGLKEGDNVWLSGVKVGTVKEVRIVSEGKVIVTLSLKQNQNRFLKQDATAAIGSDGLVGSKIVVLSPGTSSRIIDENDTINTSTTTDTQQLMDLAKDVGENAKSLTQDLSTISSRISAGKGVVGELLNDGELAREVRLAVANLTATSSNTAQASAELQKLLSELRNGDGLMPMLVRDTTLANRFESSLSNLELVSKNAASASENFESVTQQLGSDDNALGVLLRDEETATRLKSTIENAEQATDKLDENMEALQSNFLFRGFFKRKERRERREAASSKEN